MKLFGKKDDAPTDAPELDSPDETAAADTDMGTDMGVDPGVDPGGFAEPGAEEMPGDAPLDETALAAPARGPVSGGGGSKKKMIAAGGLLALLVLGGGAGYFYFMMDDGAAPFQPPPPSAVAAVPPAPVPAADPAAPANPAPMVAQPVAPAPAPANDPLNSPNPGNFAGASPQPAPAAVPGVAPDAIPGVAPDATSAGTMQPAATPPGLGPPPGEEAVAVPLTPGASPPAGTEAVAAGPAAIEAPAEEPPQDLPMPAMPEATAPVDNSAAPIAAMAGAPAGTGAAPSDAAATAGGVTAPPNSAQPAPGGKPAVPGKPSDAEMAIVQNAAVLDQLSTQATPGQPNRPFDPNQAPPDQSNALRTVDQLLEQPAIVRPLPLGWLTVRKEHESEDVDTRLTVARSALSQNNNRSALQLFNDLKKKYPKDKRILMGRAVALQKLGQYDAALSAYEAVLNNDPKNLEALTNMLGLLKLKDPALAIEKIEQLREAYPYNADITAQLGIAYAGAGRFEEGLRLLEMAEALNPGSAYVLYNKAVLYDKMGRSRQAGDLYRQIMRLAANGDLDHELPLDAIKRRLAVLR